MLLDLCAYVWKSLIITSLRRTHQLAKASIKADLYAALHSFELRQLRICSEGFLLELLKLWQLLIQKVRGLS